MPIYEYECERCSYQFELKRRLNESSEVNCPRCQSEVRRIFSPLPIIFKGPGFYVTDKAAQEKKRVDSKRDGDKPAGEGKDTELTKQDKKEVVKEEQKGDKKEGKKEDVS